MILLPKNLKKKPNMNDKELLTKMFVNLYQLNNVAMHIVHSSSDSTVCRFARIVTDRLGVTIDTVNWMLSLLEKEK